MTNAWKTVLSLCWLAVVYACFLRQYAQKILETFGM